MSALDHRLGEFLKAILYWYFISTSCVNKGVECYVTFVLTVLIKSPIQPHYEKVWYCKNIGWINITSKNDNDICTLEMLRTYAYPLHSTHEYIMATHDLIGIRSRQLVCPNDLEFSSGNLKPKNNHSRTTTVENAVSKGNIYHFIGSFSQYSLVFDGKPCAKYLHYHANMKKSSVSFTC